jgi:hypothetical protein
VSTASLLGKLRAVLTYNRTKDTMENWDEDKLRKVVLSKTGNPRTTTDVCIYTSIDLCRIN